MTTAILQFSRDGERLLVSYLEGTTRVDSIPFAGAGLLEQWALDFHELMENALAFPLTDHRATLQTFGRCLFDNLMTGELGEHFPTLDRRDLIVDLPESLLWLPVEILYDGNEFLGLRHAVGRRITAWESRRPLRKAARQDGHDRPAFLFVGGYADDDAFYEETRREIYDLCEAIERSDLFELRELLVDNEIKRPDLMRAISGADYIHFSGHSDAPGQAGQIATSGSGAPREAGWVFNDYRMTPDDIAELSGCDPFFVFSNSCRSSAVSNWRELRDMVKAFWERGTQHFVGAATRIHFQRAAEFAEAFYAEFMEEVPIGEAMRRARLAIVHNPAHHDVCWLSYALYGDPSFALKLRLEHSSSEDLGDPYADDAEPEREPDSEPSSEPAFAEDSDEVRRFAEYARDVAREEPHFDASPVMRDAPASSPSGGGDGSLSSSTNAVPGAGGLPPLLASLPGSALAKVACGWTGKPIRAATGMACAEPGCDQLIGSEGQLQQRRLWMDMAVHGASPLGGATSQAPVCRAHMPDAMRAWVEKTQGAQATIQRGDATCAWTGRTANRSEMLSGAFKKTPYGWASPEAMKKFTCAATGELIAPDLVKRDRGFIRRRGALYSEAGWWKTLKVDDRKQVSRAVAEASLNSAWRGMESRLRSLGPIELGDRTHERAKLSELLRDSDFEHAWLLSLEGGMMRGDVSVGVIERSVVHIDHYDRFEADRQPAGLDDMTRAARTIDPLDGADTTIAILSSPTGWDDAAVDHVRRLDPGRIVLVLRTAGDGTAPLIFNRSSALADALKFALAGAPRLV